MGKVLVHGTGMGQRRAALAKRCGDTSEELIFVSIFEQWNAVSCVKILKRSILGRIASCHVMKQELPMVECKLESVREEQSRERRLTLERQR